MHLRQCNCSQKQYNGSGLTNVLRWSTRHTLANVHWELLAGHQEVPAQRGLAWRASRSTTLEEPAKHSLVHQCHNSRLAVATAHCQVAAGAQRLVSRIESCRQVCALLSNQFKNNDQAIDDWWLSPSRKQMTSFGLDVHCFLNCVLSLSLFLALLNINYTWGFFVFKFNTHTDTHSVFIYIFFYLNLILEEKSRLAWWYSFGVEYEKYETFLYPIIIIIIMLSIF